MELRASISRRSMLRTLAAGAACLIDPFSAQAAPDGALVLITGRDRALSDISQRDLNRVYLGELSSIAGQNVTPFNLPPSSAERFRFDRDVLGMTPDQMAKYWIDRRIRGQGSAPRSVPTPALAVRIAAHFPGALAYVPVALLDATVKAVAIDGRHHGDANYLLGLR